jgi:hypothetical protein
MEWFPSARNDGRSTSVEDVNSMRVMCDLRFVRITFEQHQYWIKRVTYHIRECDYMTEVKNKDEENSSRCEDEVPANQTLSLYSPL